jgi:hypothetical protein
MKVSAVDGALVASVHRQQLAAVWGRTHPQSLGHLRKRSFRGVGDKLAVLWCTAEAAPGQTRLLQKAIVHSAHSKLHTAQLHSSCERAVASLLSLPGMDTGVKHGRPPKTHRCFRSRMAPRVARSSAVSSSMSMPCSKTATHPVSKVMRRMTADDMLRSCPSHALLQLRSCSESSTLPLVPLPLPPPPPLLLLLLLLLLVPPPPAQTPSPPPQCKWLSCKLPAVEFLG